MRERLEGARDERPEDAEEVEGRPQEGVRGPRRGGKEGERGGGRSPCHPRQDTGGARGRGTPGDGQEDRGVKGIK